MSNIDKHIDKQALRQHAEHIIELEGDEAICHRVLIDAYEKSDQLFTAQNVLALLDELEAKDKLNAELMEKQRLIDICQGQGLEHRIAAERRAEAAERRIAELERKEQHSERQSVIDALAGSGEAWSDIEEYMQEWDAERAAAAGKGGAS